MPTPGYEIAPIIYLVGPDGRIRWTDGRARYRHEKPDKWGNDVAAAIEAALAEPSKGP